MNMNTRIAYLVGILAALHGSGAGAQSVSTEDFTGASTTNSWYYFNGACLTAGTGASNGSNGTVAGPVPGCKNILASYYGNASDHDPVLVGGQTDSSTTTHTASWSDSVGNGALRFTNGYPYGHNENGAIVSATPFNAGSGVQITFKTVTYRGDGSGTATLATGNDGADGMSFYLIDAAHYSPTGTTPPWNGIGAYGGSLGYTCSNANPPFDGLDGGYIGLGIDEFGNFLNGTSLVSATSTGGSVGAAGGDNTALGYGKVAQRIGLRGAGSVSWAYLTQTYPAYYTTTTLNTPAYRQAAVQKTCQTGQVWNYSASATAPTAVANPTPTLYDYAPIPDAFSVLPAKTIGAEWSQGVFDRSPHATTQATPIFYQLTISQDGLLSLSYALNGSPAYTSIINGRSIAATNAIPSLPSSLYFGFAGSSGGSTNVHEIMCFKAAPATQSSTSAAVSQQLSTKIQGGAQVYFSYYNPNDWTGRVTANGLVDTAGVLSINTLANWDAQCNLTGVASSTQSCATTGASGPIAPQASRTILTWNGNDTVATPGTAGIPLQFTGSTTITSAQKAKLNAGDADLTLPNRLQYLRGARSDEINSAGAGLYRARSGILGDVIDSSPAWVGPPTSPYSQNWSDRYLPTWDTTFNENTGQTYTTFRNLEQGRLNVVYVGANDGMLHGFESGSQDTSGTLVNNTTTPNDGNEVLAYMPGAVLDIIHQYSSNPLVEPGLASLDYANTLYAHNFFVDAPPGTGDLYYNNAWHTWVIGGLGAGGSAIYALDVTNPSSAVTNSAVSTFSESNAGSTVIGEWSNQNISCNNDSGSTYCKNSLGNVSGTPLVRRLHNGSWGVIFGNGFNSTSGDAGIFVMLVDPTDGGRSFYYLSTGVGSSASPNGISYVTAADYDGDHITDYVYAGDLQGNVWRFDLTGCAPGGTTASTCPAWAQSAWAVTPGPMFRTASGQPITTPIVLASAIVQGALPSVILTFGTGQRTQFTTTTPLSYASGTQSLYGIWDWNFNTWNAHSTFPNASLIASTSSGTDQTGLSSATPLLRRSNLTAQAYAAGTQAGTIVVTSAAISWRQCTGTTTTCSGSKYGWYANLPNSNEQIVSVPNSFQQAVTVNSTIPANNAVLSCTSNTDQGITYVISPITGGTFTNTNTGATNSAFVNNYGQTNMVGFQSNETGGLTVVNTAENTTWLVGQGITPGAAGSPPPQPVPITLPPNVTVNRKTWVQLR
jgi:type IV pilus assembly protein PilY1